MKRKSVIIAIAIVLVIATVITFALATRDKLRYKVLGTTDSRYIVYDTKSGRYGLVAQKWGNVVEADDGTLYLVPGE